ncbi:hypothetical protein GCM10023094_55380 [Rhodococcus olei]|uniref:Uncharacterized protein n=1 Tax=Rhodococcus olei TaxID=2161675 RepID=A0ABP8PSD7_9NOCA
MQPVAPQPPAAGGPLTVGAIGGALAGALAGFILGWFLVTVGLEQNGDDFSDVDGGKLISILMMFAVVSAVIGAGVGLMVGTIVWTNRKNRFRAQYGLPQHGLPQPWQVGPPAPQQYMPARQQYAQATAQPPQAPPAESHER